MESYNNPLAGNESAQFKASGHEVMALQSYLGEINKSAARPVTDDPNSRRNREGLDATPVPEVMPRSSPRSRPRPAQEATELERMPAPEPEFTPEPVLPTADKDLSRVCYTGKLMSGKDWIAAKVGQKIFGLADPLYAVQQAFFPGTDKTTPGARAFLQNVGQWGRGLYKPKYPITATRALFSQVIRSFSQGGFEEWQVEWETFGNNEDIWLDSLVKRVTAFQGENPGEPVCVTNVRFENEYKRLVNEGWTHFHVLCSPNTWAKRLKSAGLKADSPEVKDESELLARAMDADITKRLSRGGSKKLRGIWCDLETPCPSKCFYTIDEFCRLYENAAESFQEAKVDLGDITLED